MARDLKRRYGINTSAGCPENIGNEVYSAISIFDPAVDGFSFSIGEFRDTRFAHGENGAIVYEVGWTTSLMTDSASASSRFMR